jgi:hypothetical protein
MKNVLARLACCAAWALAVPAVSAQSNTSPQAPSQPAAQAQATQPQPSAALPDALNRYYQDMNLVARYSLPEERVQLMSGRRDPSQAGPRLQAVDAALKRLGTYKAVNYTMRYQWGQDSQRERWTDLRTADPVDIEKVETRDGALHVRVRTYAEGPREKLRLIGEWDRKGAPPTDSGQARDYKESRTEVHTWREVDGQWLREPANLVLLDSPAPEAKPDAREEQAAEKSKADAAARKRD